MVSCPRLAILRRDTRLRRARLEPGRPRGKTRGARRGARGDAGRQRWRRRGSTRRSRSGPPQGRYLNAVVALDTASPTGVARAPAGARGAAGRERAPGAQRAANARPRPALFGDACLDTPELSLPHPRLHERAFVLVPLAELAADRSTRGSGVDRELAERACAAGVRRGRPRDRARAAAAPTPASNSAARQSGGRCPASSASRARRPRRHQPGCADQREGDLVARHERERAEREESPP